MPTVYPLNYQPDADTNWSLTPGACENISGLVPTQTGGLSTYEYDFDSLSFNTTGTDVLHAKMFTQVDGSVRLLAFRSTNIDEYDSGGTRTNRGTGYTTASDWSAAAWGNQIIAVSKANATQSSTGAGFSALGGGSPKAAHIASNVNFVVMADVDDGGSNVYSDMVWWSAIRNPSSYTPSLATQAGNVRLLDFPGPIKQIVSYGDKFVAFKENSIFVGQYIGPPYVFSWKVAHGFVGCSYPKSVVECGGRLYFAHKSGYYAFDGQQVTNIGPGISSLSGSATGGFFAPIQSSSDEETGNVWFGGYAKIVGGGTFYQLNPVIYNTRTNLWSSGGLLNQTSSGGSPHAIVQCTRAQVRQFFSTASNSLYSPYLFFGNDSRLHVAYVSGTSLSDVGVTIVTGRIGINDADGSTVRVYPRFVAGVPATSLSYCTVSSYVDENSVANSTKTFNWNADTASFDGVINGRFISINLSWSTGAVFELAGLGVTTVPAGTR